MLVAFVSIDFKTRILVFDSVINKLLAKIYYKSNRKSSEC